MSLEELKREMDYMIKIDEMLRPASVSKNVDTCPGESSQTKKRRDAAYKKEWKKNNKK